MILGASLTPSPGRGACLSHSAPVSGSWEWWFGSHQRPDLTGVCRQGTKRPPPVSPQLWWVPFTKLFSVTWLLLFKGPHGYTRALNFDDPPGEKSAVFKPQMLPFPLRMQGCQVQDWCFSFGNLRGTFTSCFNCEDEHMQPDTSSSAECFTFYMDT